MDFKHRLLYSLLIALFLSCEKDDSITLKLKVRDPKGLSGSNSLFLPSSAPYNLTFTKAPENCPNGFIPVEGIKELNTPGFCIMKYEAKNLAGTATSQQNLGPWSWINAQTAFSECRELGTRYSLVSNKQWLAVVENISISDRNWSNGSFGDGCLNQGAVGLDGPCSYDSGGVVESGATRDTKARHFLRTEEVIWDLSGNVAEWVDWDHTDNVFTPASKTCNSTNFTLDTDINAGCGVIDNNVRPYHTTLQSITGIGNFGAGAAAGVSAERGGDVWTGASAGLFKLNVRFTQTQHNTNYAGFRCVYLPDDNNDGIVDTVEIASVIELNDTDLDGISDIADSDFTGSPDSDGDGIIDAYDSQNAPVTSSVTPNDEFIGDEQTVTLAYSDIEGDLANICSVTNLVNATESTACSCNVSGVCTVGITGSAKGSASFDYNVTANTQASNVSTASFKVKSPFFSTWRTTTNGETITLPLRSGYNYNFTVDWGDGQTSEVTSDGDVDKTHIYATAGDHIITIKGVAQAWYFNNGGDKDKILSVSSFGDLGWTILDGAFYGCTNLTSFTGGNTSLVTNMTGTFRSAPNVTPNITDWDLSNVTITHRMFAGATSANPDTTNWDVSNVTNFYEMFNGATNANPNVANWDVSSGTNFFRLFANASSANPNVTNWDISNATNVARMFTNASIATPNTSNWDTSNVTDMNQMFYGATLANPDVSNWNTSKVTNMSSMFFSASSANPDVSNWDVSKVTNFGAMFLNADAAIPNTTNWDTSSAISFHSMFEGTLLANPDTTNWDTSNVTGNGFYEMFMGAVAANPNTTNWDTSGGTNFTRMFKGTTNANPNTTNWDMSNATNSYYMFAQAGSVNPDVSNWDTSKITNMAGMFQQSPTATPNTTSWNTSSVTNMANMFNGATSANPNTLNWDTSNVTTMSGMFTNAHLATPNTTNWDTSKVTNMANMFHTAKIANPDVTNWDVSKVTDMNNMFVVTDNASPNMSLWNTQSLTTTYRMFWRAQGLTSLNIANWNTSSLVLVNEMFSDSSLTNLNVSLWNFSTITNMNSFLHQVTLPTSEYSDLINRINATTVQTNISLSGGNSEYNAGAAAAHANLISNGWTIIDGGQE